MFRLMILLLLALPLLACQSNSQSAEAAVDMQLKLYPVPADQSASVAERLGRVLEDTRFRAGLKGDTRIRVTQPYPGVVMVLAPARLQASIAAAVADLDKAAQAAGKTRAKAPQTMPVRVRFWLINAKTDTDKDSPGLEPLQATLAGIRKRLGRDSHFVLAEKVSAITQAGASDTTLEETRMATSLSHQYTFTTQNMADGQLRLALKYADVSRGNGLHLDTTITLAPDQYVVLATTPGDRDKDEDTRMSLLVVRVSPLAAAKAH